MDFSRLYTMSEASVYGAFRASCEDIDDDVGLVRAEWVPKIPLVFRHFTGGSRLHDVIGTGHATIDLLSDRVIDIFKEYGFTGWTTFPIELYGKKGVRIDGYNGFAVTGRCGPIDWSRGRKIRKPPPVPQGRSYDAWVGMYFDPNTWDRSDVFCPGETTYIIVTEPVMLALSDAKVTHILFKRLTEFERTWDL